VNTAKISSLAIFLLSLLLVLFPLSVMGQTNENYTLNVAYYRTFPGMDIMGGDSNELKVLNRNVFDPLVSYNFETEKYVPGLATNWETLDKTTIQFSLREGVKFHDGSTLDSQDVANTVKLYQDRGGPVAQIYNRIKTVEIIDEHTVNFNLDGPPAGLFAWLSRTAVAPNWALNEYGRFQEELVGTGPFKFVEWAPNEHILLEANNNYWKPEEVKVSKIKIIPIPETSPRTTALLTGEVDVVTRLFYRDVPEVENKEGVKAVERLNTRCYRVFINCGIVPDKEPPYPLADPRVREALWFAIDFTVFPETFDHAKLPESIIPSGYRCSSQMYEGYYEAQPEKARELLERAGYPNGFSTRLKVRRLSSLDSEVAQLMASYLEQAGIDVEIVNQPNPVWIEDITDPSIPYQMTLFEHGGAPQDPASTIDRLFSTDVQRTHYNEPSFDAVLDKANAQTDPQERCRWYKRAQQILWGTGPTMNLFDLIRHMGYQDYVKGLNPSTDIIDFRGVSVEK